MKTKHTPGPWKWEEGQPYIEKEWNHLCCRIAKVTTDKLHWHENRIKSGEESGANAQLIAAAPELLEACKMARIEISEGTADQLTIDVLEKAIASAEGSK